MAFPSLKFNTFLHFQCEDMLQLLTLKIFQNIFVTNATVDNAKFKAL